MTAIPPTTSTANSQTKTSSNPLGVLGKDDFLKLLVTQLQHQDPMSPMDDTAFMGQMAQFSAVEQMTNVAAGIENLLFSGQVSQAVSLIGKELTYVTSDGTVKKGVASGVTIDDGEILIQVGDDTITPGDVRSVGSASAPTTPAAPAAPSADEPEPTAPDAGSTDPDPTLDDALAGLRDAVAESEQAGGTRIG